MLFIYMYCNGYYKKKCKLKNYIMFVVNNYGYYIEKKK